MTYEDIYSRSYMKKYDPSFYDDKEYAYELMKDWMKEIVAFPYVRKIFSSIAFDDDNGLLTYELVNSIDKDSDDEFVKKIFSDGFVICWMRPKVDSIVNLAVVIGGKDEKKIQSNYKISIERLDSLERKLEKTICKYGYNKRFIN